jgi:hypothetical protein
LNSEAQLTEAAPASQSDPQFSGPVGDFLTATRDEPTFREIRDKFPSFDLRDVPGADDAAGFLWFLRCEHDEGAVRHGRPLDDIVADVLRLLADKDADARDALAWLCAPHHVVYKLSEAPQVARRLVEQWQRPQAPSAAPAFIVLSYKQLRARPRLSWLIDQLLAVGSTSWLTATAGHLKSFWALDAALCVATGRDFHGRKVKRGNVVYVAAEGAVGLPDRMDAWAAKHQIEIPDAPAFGIVEKPVDVAAPAMLAGFVASVRALEPAFIVLDTQARCSVGRDLNSTSEASVFYDAVSLLASELGAHVLLLAHNNRSGQYAGNHQGPAMVDTHLTLKRDGKRAQLRCSKQKDGAAEEAAAMDFETLVFELDGRDERGRSVTSLALQSVEMSDEPDTPAKAEKQQPGAKIQAGALDVLRRDFPKGARANDWRDKCDERGVCKKSAFNDARAALVQSGQVQQFAGAYLPTEPQKETSPPSPPSPPTDLNEPRGLEPSALKSASPPSPPPVGGLADCGLRTNQKEQIEPPKPKRKKARASADSEPYASDRNGS